MAEDLTPETTIALNLIIVQLLIERIITEMLQDAEVLAETHHALDSQLKAFLNWRFGIDHGIG